MSIKKGERDSFDGNCGGFHAAELFEMFTIFLLSKINIGKKNMLCRVIVLQKA